MEGKKGEKTVMLLLIILLNCGLINCQEGKNSMDKQSPENTLEIFEIDGNKIYLINIYLVDTTGDDFVKLIGNDDYYIFYTIITDNYPKIFIKSSYYLHIVPENNTIKLEKMTPCRFMNWYQRFESA